MLHSLTELANILQSSNLVVLCLDLDELPRSAIKPHVMDHKLVHTVVYQGVRELLIKRRYAARRILSIATGSSIPLAPFIWSALGKPYFPESTSKGIFFNYSSSGNILCFALSRVGEVGCDIEGDHPSFQDTEFTSGYLSKRENQQLKNIQEVSQRRYAAQAAWVAKEAYLKFVGTGFMQEPSSAEILSQWNSEEGSWTCVPLMQFFRIPLRDRMIGALCTNSSSERKVRLESIDPKILLT